MSRLIVKLSHTLAYLHFSRVNRAKYPRAYKMLSPRDQHTKQGEKKLVSRNKTAGLKIGGWGLEKVAAFSGKAIAGGGNVALKAEIRHNQIANQTHARTHYCDEEVIYIDDWRNIFWGSIIQRELYH